MTSRDWQATCLYGWLNGWLTVWISVTDWLTEWLAVWCMASYLHQGSKLKKFQVAFWWSSKTKWSPNAKMQSPDSTRTEPQIRASFNWHCCPASGRLWLWLWDRPKYLILNNLKHKNMKRKNPGRLLHDNPTLSSKQTK